MRDDYEREALHDWLDEREPIEDLPTAAELAEDDAAFLDRVRRRQAWILADDDFGFRDVRADDVF